MTKNKKSVAYCGLCCENCLMRKGEIADLARDLRKKIRQAKFNRVSKGLSKFFKDFKNYETCYKVLGAMVRLRCRKICKDGGGPPFCKIRKCCQEKGFEGCWQCEEFEICKKLDFLKPVHEDAHIKNLKQIKKLGIEECLSKDRFNWQI